jgi:hypothetical protein
VTGFLTSVADLAAHYEPYGWFALTWAIPLVVLCALGTVFVNPGRARVPSAGLGVPVHRPQPLRLAVAVTGLAAFVIIYSYLIPYHEDLVGLDLSTVTADRFVTVPIFPATGRFFPLALQEYNVLSLFNRSAGLYHAFSIVELIVVLICCLRILNDVPGWMRCAAMAFLMVLPSFVVAFFGIVYPERDMIVWLSLWIVSLRAFDGTRRRAAFYGAVLAAQCIIYYKEPGFILVGGFAAARLAIEAVRDREWWRRRAFARFAADHLLELAHLAICGVFVVVYVVAIARHVTTTYALAAGAPNAMRNALATYAGADWVLDALAIVVVARVAASIARRLSLDSLWDALAIGAVAYALAFAKLGMTREYYQAPADFIGTLYLARLAYAALFAQPRRVAVLAALVLAWVFQRNVRDAASRVSTRKEYVQGSVRLAGFLRDYAGSHAGRSLQLYFPGVGGFELMELSSFLQFKGFDAGLGTSASPARPSFVVKSAHRYPDGRCLASEAFRCVFAPSPQPGDLVVYLAGREMPRRRLDSLRVAGTELFHYRPRSSRLDRALRVIARRDALADRNPEVRVFGVSAPAVARAAADSAQPKAEREPSGKTGAGGLEPPTS